MCSNPFKQEVFRPSQRAINAPSRLAVPRPRTIFTPISIFGKMYGDGRRIVSINKSKFLASVLDADGPPVVAYSNSADTLAAGVSHGAAALNVADDPAGRVPNLGSYRSPIRCRCSFVSFQAARLKLGGMGWHVLAMANYQDVDGSVDV